MEDIYFYMFSKLEFKSLRECCYVNKLFNKIYYHKIMSKLRCLVTGGTGFVGYNLTKELLNQISSTH